MPQLTTTESFDSTLENIIDLVRHGMESWLKAGALLVKLYDENPGNRDKVKARLSALPAGMLTTLERLGRKQLLFQVYSGAGPGFRELARMPYDVQERYVTEPVELMVIDKQGKTDLLKVAVKDLSREQARQVFGRHEPRDLSAQRAYLADLNRQVVPLRGFASFRRRLS